MEAIGAARVYARREPEKDVLYQVVQEHVETFVRAAESGERAGLPRHVARELYGYLDCGILARGAARVACGVCKDSILVAFSCRGRGFCPSCGARRMSDTAAHLVDRVLPHVAIRQWVLSLPFRVRFLCARDPSLLRAIVRVFLREVFRCLRRLLRRAGVRGARCGSVTAVQRFAGSLALDVHLHALVLDGGFVRGDDGALVFHAQAGLSQADVARVAARTAAKVKALLARCGLGEDDAEPPAEEPDLLATLQGASLTGRVALGPKAGWKIARVGAGGATPAAVRVPESAGELLADKDGYNMHAGTYVHARARDRLERLCRYILRPALARDRLSRTANGNVLWALKRPRADGTTHLVFEPLVFLERLAALVPPPRSHLVLYHGVLSSHAAWRAEVLPAAPATPSGPCAPPPTDAPAPRPGEPSIAPPAPPDSATDTCAPPSQDPVLRARRLRWAELLRRVFGIEILKCPRCGGPRKMVAFITKPAELKRLCAHLGYPTEPPPRAPPQPDLWDQRTDA